MLTKCLNKNNYQRNKTCTTTNYRKKIISSSVHKQINLITIRPQGKAKH